MNKTIQLFLSFLTLIFFIYFSFHFKIDASSDTLILQNDEDFKFFNKYNKIFPNKNFLVLAIKSNNQIDNEFIKNIKILRNNLINIDQIDSIFTLLDAPILISSNLKLSDLSNTIIPTLKDTNIPLNRVLDEFSKSPLFQNQIINNKKNITSLIIYPKENLKFSNLKKEREEILKKFKKNSKEYNNINEQYKNEKYLFNQQRNILINNIRNKINKLDFPYENYLGGIDLIADDTITYVKNDIYTFGITVSFFLIVILFLFFRSLKWVLIPLIASIYSIIVMIGLVGFLKWEITAISANFISLMLILSISMNIHIINRYRINIFQNSETSILITLKEMFYPCFYTSLTTIVAFGSLLFSDIKPIIDFGKIMIISLLIIFLTSFTILPLLISLKSSIKNNKNLINPLNNIFYNLSLNKSYSILLFNLIFFILSIIGINLLKVENSFINYFKKSSEIYQGMKLIDENLGGTTPLDIIIKFQDDDIDFLDNNSNDSKEDETEIDLSIDGDLFNSNNSSGWFNDDKLEVIKYIHKYLQEKKEIGKVQSIYSLIEVAEMINKDNLDSFTLNILYNEIPEEYIDQLILPYLSIEKNMVKISARILDSKEIQRNLLIKEINENLKNKFEIVEEIKVNGLLVLYNNMLQSLFISQIKSFGIVIFMIFLMFLLLFQSFKLSIIGIIPNIFASSFILGLIGFLGIPLDIMTITIAAITIGIAVDNTIHYIYSYKNNKIVNKLSSIKSLDVSHKTVGQAILTTSLTISFGFCVLALSNFIPTIFFGLFTALAMILAMFGVLITIPSIIKHFKL
ncbi:MAG: hypothetical protein CFH19_00869 [Alphaproteobacteria bacterium MarineAlpha5_Bin9]|nr:MAG: hypothetical protein CFH19_00869 [Alphaproteobacteria bacterium MarineAlpha5_Bin9]